MRRPIFIVFLVLSVLYACNESDKIEEEISKIPMNLNISRFDLQFAEAEAEDLPQLKQRFPYLFPEQYQDSIWVAKLNDTIQKEEDTSILYSSSVEVRTNVLLKTAVAPIWSDNLCIDAHIPFDD